MNLVSLFTMSMLGVANATDEPSTPSGEAPTWSIHAGFPWTGVEFSSPIGSSVHWFVSTESALFLRWESSAGLQVDTTPTPKLLLSVKADLGWVNQEGVLARHGPQLGGSLELQRTGRVVPRLELEAEAFWASASTEIDYQTLEETVSLFTPLPSLSAEIGIGFRLGESLILEPSLRMGPVDGEFALPAIALGLRSSSFSQTPPSP